MAWETRGNRPYYYRKVKRNGQVHSQYVGGGEAGEAAALLDALERLQQEKERVEFEDRKAADAALDREIAEYGLAVRRVVAGLLLATGRVHRPKRVWRVKRGEQ